SSTTSMPRRAVRLAARDLTRREPDRLERARQILRHLGPELDPLPAPRMPHRQAPAVQREPPEPEPFSERPIELALPVVHVPDDRMRDVLQMPPHLMKTPALRRRLD